MTETQTFYTFLRESIAQGGFTNDDVVSVIMPLLEEVSSFHSLGKVAPLDTIASVLVSGDKLDIDERLVKAPVNRLSAIKAILPDLTSTFEISGYIDESVAIGEYNTTTIKNRLIQEEQNKTITHPVYLLHYKCYEMELGHHDALGDIFVLGMILSSLALGLDFSDAKDLEEFVNNRESMIFLNGKIHPSIANIITGMTELDRRKRWKDLNEIIDDLKNYRDYNSEAAQDLAQLAGTRSNSKQSRSQFIQSKLRNRLFDLSRRNRLLYFKPNLKFLNLSVSSVPSVLNYKNIDPDTLFYWNSEVSDKLIRGKDISLSKYIRFEDNPYIAPSLDRIRLEAGKDINEYGFSQLKLVVSFLNWYNTKEQLTEKICSPLLLVPVKLVKKKGVKDQFILEITDTEAEINPVLSYQLKDLYDIRLPETLQLSAACMQELFTSLKSQIEKTRSGIVLEYNDKPKIKLIHAQAKQTLSQYKRRITRTKKVQTFHNLDYSYKADNFQPLGLQLFRNYVKPEHSSLEFLINADIQPSPSYFTDPASGEATRELYQLDEGAANPFKWEFDTCNLVLGNFNYKKMSLVRDYSAIIEENISSPVFEALFSELPRKAGTEMPEENGIHSQFNVVQADPTQNRSVSYARKGESYIIQGPPGTGKSQTISNLIADYLARGKKVLFVCEKRAAIDVVYYRLRQQGLDQLCSLIHDSQTDKKEFVLNLKSTFETFTGKQLSLKEAEQARSKILSAITAELDAIRLFHTSMQEQLEDAGVMIRELVEVLIHTKQAVVVQESSVPGSFAGYAQWLQHGETISKLAQTMKELSGNPFYARHPFRYLNEKVMSSGKSGAELKAQLEKCLELAAEISERLDLADIPAAVMESFSELKRFLSDTCSLLPLKENDRMELLTPGSELRETLRQSLQQLDNLALAVKEAAQKNSYWLNKFSQADAENAYAIVSKHEKSFFSFLSSDYRKTKRSIREAYDFSKHQVKPSLTQLISNLKAEYEADTSYAREKQKLEQFFRLGDIASLSEHIREIEKSISQQALNYAKDTRNSLSSFQDLRTIHEQLVKLNLSLSGIVNDISDKDLQAIERILQDIIQSTKHLAAVSPLVKELQSAHTGIKRLLSEHQYLPAQIKTLLARASFDTYYQANREAARIEGDHITYHSSKIRKLYKELLKANAAYIIAAQQDRFNHLLRLSELSVAGKSGPEKEEKRLILEGRKILENEFGKSMRFKSIRELATSESGRIIRELKPVWLMSPLSVSDTLPLRTDYFDVVIFDEASQITLEEGVPPVYRASQAIIVGDEMQMPPSNYFSSSAADPDDLWEEEEGAGKLLSLDADSFLTQGARKFPSVMLGWHYRSRHEALISFSNASFYRNSLLTIPDSQDNNRVRDEIVAEKSGDAEHTATKLLDRPISYHFLKNGVYDNRSNIAEADYIAALIRKLLLLNTGLSIGVVAFSMEQQGEIESAIQRLCEEDKEFEKAIEEEYKRMDDGQFAGIFFKNLENVQGDERDIIIMSTCYGYDPKGRMIMNFGPVNRRGGEKRLNVIFSRAKKHMCVVSSVKYTDIKNEYNEGANYFRKYLHYSELASAGNMDMAGLVLRSVIPEEHKPGEVQHTIMIDQICAALHEKGFVTSTWIGQSHFKCHIGIKAAETDTSYLAGILVDDSLHYSNNDLLEQYLFKPDLLRHSGWKIMQVYAKDWYEHREKTVAKLLTFLNTSETTKQEEEPSYTPAAEIPSPVPAGNTGTAAIIRLLSTEDNSHKFWEVSADIDHLVICYGRVGTRGQKIIKPFETPQQAEAEMEKLIRQKLAKGYRHA